MSASFEFMNMDFHGYQIRAMIWNGELFFFLKEIICLFGEKASANIPSQEIEETDVVGEDGVLRVDSAIREAGMYRICLRCTEPIGEVFLHWLTRDFYPKMRKKEAENLRGSKAIPKTSST